jgi:phage repressor protein C with HTH and peptisase S24 domain
VFTHQEIWQAIDRLAKRFTRSPSGLARRAGLDPTTFNKSKRVSRGGRPRWPSTESVAKILAATGVSAAEFLGTTGNQTAAPSVRSRVPVIGLAKAGQAGFFDDAGFPTGRGWDEVEIPGLGDAGIYALEIVGDSMTPAFRDGTMIVVSPKAPVRRGDRVVVKTRDGEVMAKVLSRRTASKIELASLNTDHADRTLDAGQVEWLARIVWASQ